MRPGDPRPRGPAGRPAAAARRGRLGRHDRLAEPRLCRGVRQVVRDLRRAAAAGHDPGRRAPAAAVSDAAGLDGRHDRARGSARGGGRLRRVRCSPTSASPVGACRTTASRSSGTSPSSSACWRARGRAIPLAAIAPALVRCIERVPADVPVGLHLCYGDYGHEHFKQPESLRMQVDLVNALTAAAARPLDWASFTVPQARDDSDYFDPAGRPAGRLGDRALLRPRPLPPRRPAGGHDRRSQQSTSLDASPGGSRVGHLHRVRDGRVAAEDVPALLDLHRRILTRRVSEAP